MRYWPVPNTYSKDIPKAKSQGSFWENRGDRRHCGIDIYAPDGSEVLSIEDGRVIDIGVATSPDKVPYWNTTYYILIKNRSGHICKYSELKDVVVNVNDDVKAGELIGHVGTVIDTSKVDESSPDYIQKIVKEKRQSMLHFELYRQSIEESEEYVGGNWFGDSKPTNLLDPTEYLKSVSL